MAPEWNTLAASAASTSASMNTSANDYWPFGALQLVQFNGREFEPVGQAIAVR